MYHTVNDLKTYEKLSDEDLKSDDFRFATIIVTGNLERREINSYPAKVSPVTQIF